MAESFELREEIKRNGEKYFIHTTFLPEDKTVKTSFFKEGRCFDHFTRRYDGIDSRDSVVELSKSFHGRNRDNFLLLLEAKRKIGSSKKPSSHLKLARTLLLRNLFEEAIEEAETAINKGEKGSGPYKIMGEAYYRAQQLQKAQEAVEKGLRINPDYPDLHNLLGKIFHRKKECRKAVDCFKRSISLNCYYGEPYLNMARTYVLNSIIKQDYELSRELKSGFEDYLEKAFTLNPFINSSDMKDIKKLFNQENFEEILEKLDQLENLRDRAYIDSIIGELHLMILRSGSDLEEKEIDGYLARVEEIIDKNPNFADAYNSLGILHTAKCKISMDHAEEAFRKALDINEKYEKAVKNIRLTENEKQGVFILLKALLD